MPLNHQKTIGNMANNIGNKTYNINNAISPPTIFLNLPTNVTPCSRRAFRAAGAGTGPMHTSTCARCMACTGSRLRADRTLTLPVE